MILQRDYSENLQTLAHSTGFGLEREMPGRGNI